MVEPVTAWFIIQIQICDGLCDVGPMHFLFSHNSLELCIWGLVWECWVVFGLDKRVSVAFSDGKTFFSPSALASLGSK